VGWLNAEIDYLTEDSIQDMKLHLKVQGIQKQLKSTLSKITIKKESKTSYFVSSKGKICM